MKGVKRMPRVKSAKDFAQYDSRWGNKGYPQKPYTMSGNGCGPTSCADIIVTNPKYRKITPDTIRKWMIKHGYAVKGHGTAWAGISACLKAYGFKVTNHPTMKEFFAEMAKEGRCGIILFRAGTRGGVTWTTGGHFVSVSGYKYKNKKHYLYVNDPYRRHHDGWYCYEDTMKGLIPQVWSCYLPKADPKKPETKEAKKAAPKKTVLNGFDISYWQGKHSKADFLKAKKAGFAFVIIRTSFNRTCELDSCFENNYKAARAAGLTVGAYHYSTAVTEAQAKKEATTVLKIIKGKEIDAPVFIDLEDKCQKDLGKEKLKAIALAFTETIKAAGYKAGVYASYDWLTNRIGKIPSGTYVWLAQYPKATYKGRYNFHQYTSNGAVSGFGKIDVDTWTKGGVNR